MKKEKFTNFSGEAYMDYDKRCEFGANEKVMMMKFKKYEVGDLVLGLRAGTINHLRPGNLVYGYYTINGIFMNCAWVIRCLDDGKLRSFQAIKKIRNTKELTTILKFRKSYLKELKRARPIAAAKHANKALMTVLLAESK